MVPQNPKTATERAFTPPVPQGQPNTSLQTRSSASISTQATIDGLQFIRQSIEGTGLSPEAIEIYMSSWRKSTQQQYKSYMERWLKFCSENDFSPSSPHISKVIKYLLSLFNSGLGYSCLLHVVLFHQFYYNKVGFPLEVTPWL